jgi:hypothetical protein
VELGTERADSDASEAPSDTCGRFPCTGFGQCPQKYLADSERRASGESRGAGNG